MLPCHKAQKKRRMAVSLSIYEYLNSFLLKSSETGKQDNVWHNILVAVVYKTNQDGTDDIIYSRKISGNKNIDAIADFVKDMTGSTGVRNGGLKRTSSVIDIDGESEDKLPGHSSITIEILASRSPSNVGSEQLQRLLEYCKRNSIKISIRFTFGHPYSWDNKYNKEGMLALSEKGIKLKPLSLQQGISLMVDDIGDTLETFDELQTARGTILLDYNMLKRVASKLREAITIKSDFYYQDNDERLQEMLGYQNRLRSCENLTTVDEPTTFTLVTYRDYFLLQNTDEIWAKVKVDLSKKCEGIMQDQELFQQIYTAPGPSKAKKYGKNNAHEVLGSTTRLRELTETIWKQIGENITLHELGSQDDIVVHVTAVLSEYPDRLKWYESIEALHVSLADRINDSGMGKVRMETRIRYAMNLAEDDQPAVRVKMNGHGSEHASVTKECLHVQDILFDMLEDLEDNVKRLGNTNFDRGANVEVDKSSLSSALGLLNRTIRIRTEDGAMYSMNSDFVDVYAENAM